MAETPAPRREMDGKEPMVVRRMPDGSGMAYRFTGEPLTMADFAAPHDRCLKAKVCVVGGPCPHARIPTKAQFNRVASEDSP